MLAGGHLFVLVFASSEPPCSASSRRGARHPAELSSVSSAQHQLANSPTVPQQVWQRVRVTQHHHTV